MVKVPVPLMAPLKPSIPSTVGLAPKGKEQLLLIIKLSPVMVTRLKATLLQSRVLLEPLKVTVPELWVKSASVMVKSPPMVIVPVGAIKEPEEKVKISPPIKVVYELKSTSAPATV